MLYQQFVAPVGAMGVLQLDLTVLIQLGIFLTLLYLLNRFLFQPVLQAVQLRQRMIHEHRVEAEALRLEAEHRLRQVDEQIKRARHEGRRLRKQLVEEGLAQEESIVEEARQASRAAVEHALEELAESRKVCHEHLQEEAGRLAGVIVRRLVAGGLIVATLCLVSGVRAAPQHADPHAPAAASHAASGGHADAAEGHAGFNWWAFGGSLVNVLLLVGGGALFARKPIEAFFRRRRECVAGELEQARRSRQEAAELLEQARLKLTRMGQERQAVLEHLRHEGEAERQRMVDAARARAERVWEEAELLIDQARRRTQTQMQLDLIESAVGLAEAQLSAGLAERNDDAQFELLVDRLREVLPVAEPPVDSGAAANAAASAAAAPSVPAEPS